MTILVFAGSMLASLALVLLLVRRLPARWPWLAGAAVAWTLGAQVLDRTILPGAYSDLEPRRYGLRGNTPEADGLLEAPFTDGHARVAYDEGYLSLHSFERIQSALRHKERVSCALAALLGVLVGGVGRAIGSRRPPRGLDLEAPSRPQVVGMPCAVCDERIVTKLDGHACPTCDRPLHANCTGSHACEEEAS